MSQKKRMHPLYSLYDYHDHDWLQEAGVHFTPPVTNLHSLDELLIRDRQREEDGFPRKIRVGKLLKPSRDGSDKVVVVPTTVEEKLLHDAIKINEDGESDSDEQGGESGGAGTGEEGEIIGEEPIRQPGDSGQGSGQGEEGPHEVESNAYDLGRVLTEQFSLPNLKDKGKKRALTRYNYELTDKHPGRGQLLDKKSTLRRVVRTNIALGRIQAGQPVDPADLLVAPNDRIFRVLSPEKDLESQALVFFVRDYSGSMHGKPTELVVTQHVLIYAWLLYQYAKQVESRFILHDTQAKEVADFHTYYHSKVAGGTRVASAYRLVNQLVESEGLAKDYNIYIFHGTDGDDWDTLGREALPELKKMLQYANRIGISIAQNSFSAQGTSEVERYLRKSALLVNNPNLIRLDTLKSDSDEDRLIEGIKKLLA